MNRLFGNLLILLVSLIYSSPGFAIEAVNKDKIDRVDRYLEQSIEHGFSGAVLISQKGNILLNKGYGFANRENRSPITDRTVFDLGSNSKQFTAAAIMVLVQQNKLALTDRLAQFFEAVPADKKDVTVHHLLSHSSGLVESVGRDFEHLSEADFFARVFASPLKHAVGAEYAYSNIGYSLLAKIIELVSSTSYEKFLQAHLFIPSGMYQTGYLLPEWADGKLALGYARGFIPQGSMIERYQNDGQVSWHLKGNGGINSTQNDMRLWLQALKNNRVLTEKSFEVLTSGQAAIGEGWFYGYGWGVDTSDPQAKRLSHNGSNGVFAHSIIWYPYDDLLVLFATNTASENTERMAKPIERTILEADYQPETLRKNPFFAVYDFTSKHSPKDSQQLLHTIKTQYSQEFDQPDYLNFLGYRLLEREQAEWAIELFKINIELFPEDSNGWDSLGDAYVANQQQDQARMSYEKAVQLGHEGSLEKLEQLSP